MKPELFLGDRDSIDKPYIVGFEQEYVLAFTDGRIILFMPKNLANYQGEYGEDRLALGIGKKYYDLFKSLSFKPMNLVNLKIDLVHKVPHEAACDGCNGKGEIRFYRECEHCGDEHECVSNCENCDGTGKVVTEDYYKASIIMIDDYAYNGYYLYMIRQLLEIRKLSTQIEYAYAIDDGPTTRGIPSLFIKAENEIKFVVCGVRIDRALPKSSMTIANLCVDELKTALPWREVEDE